MKKILAALALVSIAAFALSGCEKTAAADTAEPVYPTEPDEEDWERQMQYREENTVEEAFLSGQNRFAFKTSQAVLSSREENAVYSPVSLYYALSLAAAGTAGETAEELYDFLECEDAAGQMENAGKLYRTLYRDNPIGKTLIATSLWADEKLKLKETFKDNATEQFYASIYMVDFADPGAGEQMGEWVKSHTAGTIAPEIKTSPEQVMSILNTLYFYDQWVDRFQKSETKEDVFYLADGTEKEVDFMNRKFGSHGFSKGDKFTRSSLSLKENGSMVFVLPDEGVSVDELLKSPEELKRVLEEGSSGMGEVTFKVPKFTSDSRFELKDMMEKLGVTKIFSDGDFSAMTDQGDVVISQISQNGHISVNEEGVEASAFTEIQYAGAALPDGKAEMILNRPFIYGIKNQNIWLFIGVCDNPA